MQASEMYANNVYNLLDHVANLSKATAGGTPGAAAFLPNLSALMKKLEVDGNKPGEQSVEELVVAQSVVAYDGKVLCPPPPPPPSPLKTKEQQGTLPQGVKKASVFGG